MLVIVLAVVFTVKILGVESYNFDVKFPEIISSNYKDDYFGFSVFLQKGTPSIVIVGAVKGNSTFMDKSAGVVYKCVLNGSKTCSEYTLGQNVDSVISLFSIMQDQLLGATIDGGPSVGDPIVVCAPRFRRQQTNGYLSNGACFILNNSSLTGEPGEALVPLLDKALQIFASNYFYGLGEAGMSLHFLQENSEILIGAPGVYAFKGTLIRYQLKKPFIPYSKPSNQIIKLSIPNPYYYGLELERSSYLGFSSSYGIFDENRGLWYVAAAPRASFLKGKVFMFSYPDTNDENIMVHKEFLGEQMGSYFGFSLLAFKSNDNTNVSDLLVGAPMYSLKGYDEGCVYYYKNNGYAEFGDPLKIFGDTVSGSRFGYAIANLGDINHDSYTDIAISAPYEIKEGGAVYIFLGQEYGLSQKYSQKIKGSSLGNDIHNLGFSLSTGLDIDQNSFNDLAIGDFKSGKVIVIKTKPVIKYFGKLVSDVAELAVAQNIQFNVTFCLRYDNPSGIVKSIETVLYYYPDHRILMANEIRTVTITLNEFYCQNLSLTITNNTITSFDTPVRFKINYEVRNQSSSDFCKTCPMTDPGAINSIYLDIPFSTGCKNSLVCFPDLRVSANFEPYLNYLVIGKESFLNMKVVVTNFDEPAYLCELILKIPHNIEMRRVPNRCSQTENELHCFLKNILFKHNMTEIDFEFDLTRLTHTQQKQVIFYLEVNSNGNDTNKDNNKINMSLPLRVESFIQIDGESQPDQLMFNDTLKFSHKYTFVNLGPSPLQRLNFEISLPVTIGTAELISKYSFQSSIEGIVVECDDEPNVFLLEPDKFYSQSIEDIDKVDSSANKTFVNFPFEETFFINCTDERFITCKKLICHVNQDFKKDQLVYIDLLLEISVDTIKKQLESKRIVLFQTDVNTRYSNETRSIRTIVLSSDTEVSYGVYVIDVLIGVVILLGIIFLLYKLKFFNRPLMEKLVNTEEITSVLGDDSLENEDELLN